MSETISPPAQIEPGALPTATYDMIEEAVRETARGRWFLAEYARRNRAADTLAVLEAIGRLETQVAAATTATRATPDIERIRMDVREMAHAIARTKAEIAAIKPEGTAGGRFEEASVELDAIVQATATATGDILGAAETIQEIAWTLREMGTEAEVCDLIDAKTTDIYTACSFQDITGQRTRKVIGVLRFLEERIDSMMAIWGDAGIAPAPAPTAETDGPSLLNGPARPGEGLDQSDVDLMMDAEAQEPASVEPASVAVTARNDALEEETPAPSAEPPLTVEQRETTVEAAPIEAEPAPVLVEVAKVAPMPPEPVPVEARATAAAALSTGPVSLAPAPRPPRFQTHGLPTLEEIEKLSFVEKVALTS